MRAARGKGCRSQSTSREKRANASVHAHGRDGLRGHLAVRTLPRASAHGCAARSLQQPRLADSARSVWSASPQRSAAPPSVAMVVRPSSECAASGHILVSSPILCGVALSVSCRRWSVVLPCRPSVCLRQPSAAAAESVAVALLQLRAAATRRWPRAVAVTALHCTALHCTALHCRRNARACDKRPSHTVDESSLHPSLRSHIDLALRWAGRAARRPREKQKPKPTANAPLLLLPLPLLPLQPALASAKHQTMRHSYARSR